MSEKEKAARGTTPGTASEAHSQPQFKLKPTALKAQWTLVVDMIRAAPCSTYALRDAGISHPSGRVRELRRQGYRIASFRRTAKDSAGVEHAKVAVYSLLHEPDGVGDE